MSDTDRIFVTSRAYDAEDVGDADRIAVVASAEPAIVFASLVNRVVPDICDACTVDLVDDGAPYRVAAPASGPTLSDSASMRTAHQHKVRQPFADPDSGYDGIATFTWTHREPSATERVLVALLVEHANQTVLLQRSEDGVAEAAATVGHLNFALQSSRQIGAAIGIVMARYGLSQEPAFKLLSLASQYKNTKLRELAADVVDTGWLDPSLLETMGLFDQPPPPTDLDDARLDVGATDHRRRRR